MRVERVIWIVMDSVGIGELPDADRFGDQGSNTIGNIAKSVKGFALPNLVQLGLGNIRNDLGIGSTPNPDGAFGQAAERSPGKDTTTGHWEMAGLILDTEFPVYEGGFPEKIIQTFEEKIGRKSLGNKAASGTVILEELGAEHIATGSPIVYTSADSVFQIAMHEGIIPIEEQYEICEVARELLPDIGRVIARPFIGEAGSFKRTANRKDFSLFPPGKTVLDIAVENQTEVMAVGKIKDIFAGKGITQHVKSATNMEGVDKTLDFIRSGTPGIIMTNLVDFDMLFGHRNDVKGYANALQEFDARIPELLNTMEDSDVMILTADHGCDPTTSSTDHSREYIPVLVAGQQVQPNTSLGTLNSFADIGATVSELLGLPASRDGKSFANRLAGG